MSVKEKFYNELISSLQEFKTRFIVEQISDNFYIFKQLDLVQDAAQEFLDQIGVDPS